MAAERRSSVMVHVVLDERDAIFRPESDERRLQEIVTSELVCNEIMQMQAFRRCVLDMSHVEIKSAAVQQETAIAWRFLVVAVMQINRAGVSFAKQIVLNLGRPKLGIYVRLVFAEKTTVLGLDSHDAIHRNQLTHRIRISLSQKTSFTLDLSPVWRGKSHDRNMRKTQKAKHTSDPNSPAPGTLLSTLLR